jgi:hypothetical protein
MSPGCWFIEATLCPPVHAAVQPRPPKLATSLHYSPFLTLLAKKNGNFPVSKANTTTFSSKGPEISKIFIKSSNN